MLVNLWFLSFAAFAAAPIQTQAGDSPDAMASLTAATADGAQRPAASGAKLLRLKANTIFLVKEVASRHQVDPALVLALIEVESGFQSSAVSPKGATGLMQMMPDTAFQYGLRKTADLHDPATNIDIGTRHLKNLLKATNGNLSLALASYNAGRGAIQRSGNTIPAYRETMLYVPAILGRIPFFQNFLRLNP